MKREKQDAMRQALYVCLESNLFGPREVCLLQCCCKALQNGMQGFKWHSYPQLVELSLAQPSAITCIMQHGQQLQQICFKDSSDALLRNIFADLQRRGPQLTFLQVQGDSLLCLPPIPLSVQQLDVSGCTRLQQLSSALPHNLRMLRCLECHSLKRADGVLPATLQQLSIGGRSIQHTPPLQGLQQLTRLELAEVHSVMSLSTSYNLPAGLKHLTCR
jgi:hypothetical protein